MKRLKEFGFIIGILLIVSFHIFLSLPVKTSPINPPPYSAPVQILDENGKVIAFANAFLVDRELGLLITNEHVIASGRKWRVEFGGRSYLAKTQKEWINQNADLAILRLINYQSAELPSATDLSGSAYVGLSVQARGYKYNGESYCAESVVLSLKEPWQHEDSQYNHGIKTGVGWRNYLTRNVVRSGCSGSAVLGRNGKVVAIVSGTLLLFGYSYLIPSWEIERLLKRVRSSLGAAL